MEFVKGTMIGIIAGACIGYMNNETICGLMKSGRREFRKLKRKMSF